MNSEMYLKDIIADWWLSKLADERKRVIEEMLEYARSGYEYEVESMLLSYAEKYGVIISPK